MFYSMTAMTNELDYEDILCILYFELYNTKPPHINRHKITACRKFNNVYSLEC